MTDRRLYQGPLTDNSRWDRLTLRPDDVIVATPPKCGTTWMQTIVALLLCGDPDVETELSIRMPWVDIRFREIDEVADRLEAMKHRRSMKSHTPMDGLPWQGDLRYICVFRHPLDAHLSFRGHVRNMPVTFLDAWFPEDDTDGTTFRKFLSGGPEADDMDAMPLAHILRHYEAARAVSDQPNVALFHYADMSRDLAGTVAQVARFLDVSWPEDVMAQLVQSACFDHMRQHASRYAPGGGTGFYKSDAAFFRSGRSGQWRDALSPAEIAAYDAMMNAQLTGAERAWLEYGAAGVSEGGA